MANNNLIRKKSRIAGFLQRTFIQQKLNNWMGYLLIGLIAVAFGYLLSRQLQLGITLIGALVGLAVLVPCLMDAAIGLYINVIYSFLICFFSRLIFEDYSQIGILSDILLLGTLLSFILKKIRLKESLNEFFHTPVVIWIMILNIYVCMEIFNPLPQSFAGVYIGIRKSVEILLVMFISFQVFTDYKKIEGFIKVLFVLCTIAGIYGCFQQWHGLFEFERSWVMADPTRFGLIFIAGEFRKFSIMSDPTAYGIMMAACSCFFIIRALAEKNKTRRWIILGGVVFMLLGMSYSGTRTSNIMMVAGIVLYILLSANNPKTWLFGAIATVIFLFLLYAPIYSNTTLNRFRSSFMGRNDESYNLREMNRALIQPYILRHPFGGGVATTGAMGVTFNPGHFLAGFQTDNGYLQFALELGWLGLAIICIQYFIILREGIRGYFRSTDEKVKNLYAATLVCIFAFTIAELAQTAIGQLSDELVYPPMLALLLQLKKFNPPSADLPATDHRPTNLPAADPPRADPSAAGMPVTG